jgi:DNA transposition AAA+ family ATPase
MADPAFSIEIQAPGLRWDEGLRRRLVSFIDQYQWSYGQISRDMQRFYGKRKDHSKTPGNVGIGESTLYRYAALQWEGSQEALERLEGKVQGWLDHREKGSKLGDVDESVKAAKLIQYGLAEAHQSRKFVVITGPSGMGKTLLTRHFANSRTRGGLIMVECYDGHRPRAFLGDVCEALGESGKGSIDDLIKRAVRALTELPRPLAIDEANFLSDQSINHLVHIWNQTKVGIALLGTEELDAIVTSETLQRVRSRLKQVIYLGELSRDEIRQKLVESFGAQEVTAKLVELARVGSFGGFRDLDTIIETAIDYRERNPDKPLEKVFERVSGRAVDLRRQQGGSE